MNESFDLERLWHLLRAIDQAGSINGAARLVKGSYRHAWEVLRRAEEALGMALVQRQTGGEGGGGSRLTPGAREWLARHARLRQEADRCLRGAAEAPAQGDLLVIATTICPVDVGLLGRLEAAFAARTGIVARHIAAGSGQAMELARRGYADLVLAHAPAAERSFVAEGWGTARHPVMQNDFVLVGPPGDPARVKDAPSLPAALRLVARRGAPFVSRGDRSGTHLAEASLWQQAGVQPDPRWHLSFGGEGQGSASALRHASAVGAYTLVDRATWRTLQGEVRLAIVREGDPGLRNTFSLIPTSPERHAHVNGAAARRFVGWLAGPEGSRVVASFGVPEYGEPLFRLV